MPDDESTSSVTRGPSRAGVDTVGPIDVRPLDEDGTPIESNVFISVVDAVGDRYGGARFRPSTRSFRLPELVAGRDCAIEITAAGHRTTTVRLASVANPSVVEVTLTRRRHTPLVLDVRPQLERVRALARRAYADPSFATQLAAGDLSGFADVGYAVDEATKLSRETRLLAALVADAPTIEALTAPDVDTVSPPGTADLVRRQLDETWILPPDAWDGLASVIEARCRFYAISRAVLNVELVRAWLPSAADEDRRVQLSRVLASADFPGLDVVVALLTRAQQPELVPIDAFGRGLLRTLPVTVPDGYFARRRTGRAYPSLSNAHPEQPFLAEASNVSRRLDDPVNASFSLASLAAILDDAFSSMSEGGG